MKMDAVKFHIGQTVYFRFNPENTGIVTGILFRPGVVIYYVVWADQVERSHFDIELTAEKAFSTPTPD